MKLQPQAILLILALSAPFAAFACPDLEGEYTCRGNGQTQNIQIQQDLRNDTWTYYIDNENGNLEIITDSQRHHLGSLGDIKNASYTASCQSNGLKIDANGEFVAMGRTFKAKTKMNFKSQSNGNITSQTQLVVNGRNLPAVKLNCNPL